MIVPVIIPGGLWIIFTLARIAAEAVFLSDLTRAISGTTLSGGATILIPITIHTDIHSGIRLTMTLAAIIIFPGATIIGAAVTTVTIAPITAIMINMPIETGTGAIVEITMVIAATGVTPEPRILTGVMVHPEIVTGLQETIVAEAMTVVGVKMAGFHRQRAHPDRHRVIV